MTNKQFDDIIKSKMSGLADGKTSADWDQFSELLKQSEGFSDLDFDKKVVDKFKGHHTGYSESHWAMLKARLEREEFIRTRLYFAKLAEIAAVFLLLFAALNFAGLNYDNGTEPDPSMFAHLYDDVKSQHEVINKQVSKNKSDLVLLQKSSQPQILTKKVTALSERKQEINRLVRTAPSLKINQNKFASLSSLPISNLESLVSVSSVAIERDQKGKKVSQDLSGSFASTESLVLAIATPEINSNPLYAAHLYADTKTKYELKPYIGIGIAATRTPYDDIYDIESNTSFSSQKKSGLAFAAGSGNLKIASGFEWNNNKYKPVQVEEVYGSLRAGIKKTSLKEIALNIAKIPIGVKYDFVKKKQNADHSFYVGANVGINGIMHTRFDIDEQDVALEDYRNVPLSANRSNTPESKLSRKNFSKGILQGGDVVSNLFIDTSLELGYEKRISKNANLAVSANYSKYLGSQGLGPNKDRYDNLTFNLGVNYLMN